MCLLIKVDEKVEYRVFKKHMYGGPKGLGDPNYRHGTFWIPIFTFPLQRNVKNGGGPHDTAGGVGRCNPLLIYTLFSPENARYHQNPTMY